MINPNKECYWTNKQITEISYLDGVFRSSGISLSVILQAFVDTDFIWYSKTYGDFDDNVTLIAVDKTTNLLLDETSYKDQDLSPIKEAIGENLQFEEYLLSDKAQTNLGIKLDESNCIIQNANKCKYQIYIHDNCFSVIEPVDIELLTKIINCISRQHSFYLKANVNWSNIISTLTNKLIEWHTLQLKSYSKANQIKVWLGKDSNTIIKRFFNSSPCDVIHIDNECAYYL